MSEGATIFASSTLLTKDWLANELGYAMPNSEIWQKAAFRDYYSYICAYIRSHHYLKLSPEDIESYLTNGTFTYTDACGHETTITCDFTTAAQRTYYFKLAQARQLIYDFTSGRGAMIRGEENKYNVCPDMVDVIKLLGLYQRTEMTI